MSIYGRLGNITVAQESLQDFINYQPQTLNQSKITQQSQIKQFKVNPMEYVELEKPKFGSNFGIKDQNQKIMDHLTDFKAQIQANEIGNILTKLNTIKQNAQKVKKYYTDVSSREEDESMDEGASKNQVYTQNVQQGVRSANNSHYGSECGSNYSQNSQQQQYQNQHFGSAPNQYNPYAQQNYQQNYNTNNNANYYNQGGQYRGNY